MSPPPVRTPEQRVQALAAAVRARAVQARVRAQLKSGDLTLADVLAHDDPAVGALHVTTVMQSLPRHGERRARAALERLRIAPTRRLRGLGPHQRAALCAYGERARG